MTKTTHLGYRSMLTSLTLIALPGIVHAGYCNWGPNGDAASSICDGSVQGGDWCNQGQPNCEQGCDGKWCIETDEPQPMLLTGYCNWGPNGDAASSICDGNVQGGDWCNQGQPNCEQGCGGKWCVTESGGESPSGTNVATTTRYWDCAGGSCGCSYVPEGKKNPEEPAMCHSNAMFAAPEGNEYGAKFYGTAAISSALGGGDWMAEGCGKCWKVTGTSNIAGYEGTETTMVLKGTNFCPDDGNPLCAAGPHFDIAAPGFDVLEYSLSHSCPYLETAEKEGFKSCSQWMISDLVPNKNCDCSKFNSPVLRTGCENFLSLKWDSVEVVYEEVDCPAELSSLHCGYPYPAESEMPNTCASNV